jgi:hypothetical protein
MEFPMASQIGTTRGPPRALFAVLVAVFASVGMAQDPQDPAVDLIPAPPFDDDEDDARERALLASASVGADTGNGTPVAGFERDRGRGPIDLSDADPYRRYRPDPYRLPSAGLDLRLRLELPSFGWDRSRHGEFVRQVTLTRLPPGSLIIRREGFHGFVTRKVQQRLRAMWLDSLNDLYRAGTLDDAGLRDAMRDMGNALADESSGGRWWDRTWWELMPEAKGGAPDKPIVYTVGERLEILRLGPIALTNDFKGRVDRFTLSLEPDSERVIRSSALAARFGLARDQARLDRDDDLGDDAVTTVRDAESTAQDQPLLRLLLETHDDGKGLLAGTGWTVRLRPAVRLNLVEDPTKALKDLSMRVLFEWSPHEGGPSMIEIEGAVRFSPQDQDVRAGVQLTFLFF